MTPKVLLPYGIWSYDGVVSISRLLMQTSSYLLFPPLGKPLLYLRYLHRHDVFINSFATSVSLARSFTALHLQSIYLPTTSPTLWG